MECFGFPGGTDSLRVLSIPSTRSTGLLNTRRAYRSIWGIDCPYYLAIPEHLGYRLVRRAEYSRLPRCIDSSKSTGYFRVPEVLIHVRYSSMSKIPEVSTHQLTRIRKLSPPQTPLKTCVSHENHRFRDIVDSKQYLHDGDVEPHFFSPEK